LTPYTSKSWGGGRAPATTKKKKKETAERERAHKKEIAVFFTHEVPLDRFLKRDAARALAFLFDRFLFFFIPFLQLSRVKKKRGVSTIKRRGQKIGTFT